MHRHSRPGRALGVGLSMLLAALIPDGARAQVQTAEATPIEKIEVTGSAIRRTDTETPSPVQVISADDLKRTGQTSVSEVLRNLAANGEGSLSQSFNFAFAGGASGIALRGLFVGDTLVLIDGHRTAPYSISDDNQRNFVDVTSIPLDAIDHIEILRDGASALYGTDAIAGVVNIILKKTFNGLHVSADLGESQRGDGQTTHLSALYGLGNLSTDGRNGYVALEYRHQEPIFSNDRTGLWSANNPKNWARLGGIDVTPGVPNAAINSFAGGLQSNTGVLQNPANTSDFHWLPGCTQALQSAGKCGFLFSGNQIQPPSENVNLTSKFTFKFAGDWESSTEFSVWQSRSEEVGSPYPYYLFAPNYPSGFVVISTNGTPHLPPGSPYVITVPKTYPGYPSSWNGQPAPLIYTYSDIGDPQIHFATASYRFVENLQGSAFGWDVNAAIGMTYVHTDELGKNFIDFPNLQTALNNGSYHVGQLAGTNSPAVYNFIAPEYSYGASDLLDFASVKASRDLLQLPGGPLSVAVGTDVYHKNQNTLDAPSVTAGLQGGTTGYALGHQNDAGAFTEFDAQILKRLEFNAALRVDHEWTDYGASGNAVKPKFGLKASPIDILTLRGTWSQGFRLPSPAEAGVSGTLFGASAINDPALCPGAPGAFTNIPGLNYYFPSQCALTPVNVQSPTSSLRPERSDNWTAGFIFEPTRWFYSSVDYFNYRIKDQIWSPFELGGLLGSFGDYVRSAPVTLPAVNALTGVSAGNQTTPKGLILYKSFPYVNGAVTEITGVDLEFRFKFNFSDYGRVTLDVNATHQFKYDVTDINNHTYRLAGTQGPSGVSGNTGNPKDHANASLTWDRGPAEVTLNMNYIGMWSTNDPSLGQTSPCEGPPSGSSLSYNIGTPFSNGGIERNLCYVASWTDFDLYASYKIDKHWSVHAAILNLFDREPSFDSSTYGGGGGGFYSTLEQAGAVGRFFSGGVAYDF